MFQFFCYTFFEWNEWNKTAKKEQPENDIWSGRFIMNFMARNITHNGNVFETNTFDTKLQTVQKIFRFLFIFPILLWKVILSNVVSKQKSEIAIWAAKEIASHWSDSLYSHRYWPLDQLLSIQIQIHDEVFIQTADCRAAFQSYLITQSELTKMSDRITAAA